jgi:hypothetical protein
MASSKSQFRAGCAALVIVAWVVLSGAAAAQAYRVPHNAFGQPDFSGIWTNASVTQLERPTQFKSLTLTEAEARTLEKGYEQAVAADAKPSDPKAGAPSAGADPGGYNTFWIDPGTKVGRIKGQLRSSWLVEPADGKLPYSPEGRRLFLAEVRKISGAADNPEYRQVAERCLLGFGSTGGPPMLNVLYNNTYQIQQDRDHVVILIEMDHDARIVRLTDRTHPPANIRQWMGDSFGWWEGDTLVVETTNFNPGEVLRPGIPTTIFVSKDAKVTERFTRVSATQILYEFRVEDPTAYTRTWRGEMPLNATKGPVYEYACHEGNYALPSILRGARRAEDAAAGKIPAPGGSQ